MYPDNITTFDPEELGERVAILLGDRCDRATAAEVSQAMVQAKWELKMRHQAYRERKFNPDVPEIL